MKILVVTLAFLLLSDTNRNIAKLEGPQFHPSKLRPVISKIYYSWCFSNYSGSPLSVKVSSYLGAIPSLRSWKNVGNVNTYGSAHNWPWSLPLSLEFTSMTRHLAGSYPNSSNVQCISTAGSIRAVANFKQNLRLFHLEPKTGRILS
jgi:hypothetical protein